ncbi:MAG TPA: hypothetical protein PKV16_03750 [Caldisericia bacterium]|nr:hypothetical protein [Caldisericia bacterium]HPF48425.1 hypothetical protein [Caldisericia bacterium]HPI83395.1 hypothetical protein [Caldisericia bacterium]HPQ92879.1 hypothetical protein [Caldisericia bacterium]HRV74023.1 hypothetical protein [Caldisericia bacterium]
MKKTFALILSFVLLFGFLTGCGQSEDETMVLSLLDHITKGEWGRAYDLTHTALLYTVAFEAPIKPETRREAFVDQMDFFGRELKEFFAGAKFSVVESIKVDEWSVEGIPLVDVTRVIVSMEVPTPRVAPDKFATAKEFEETGKAELLVAVDSRQNGQRKVVFDFGKTPNAMYIYEVRDDNEFTSPAPNRTVIDPDPSGAGDPSSLDFYDVFDENYQRKYYACVIDVQNAKTVVALTGEDKVLYVRQIDPLPKMGEELLIWDQFIGQDADSISSFLPKTYPDPLQTVKGKELREKIAQVLKLHYIGRYGYAEYASKYPFGLLAVKTGTPVDIPTMEDVLGNTITSSIVDGRPIVFIAISSCGSCMNKAVEIKDELNRQGLKDEQIVFISKSARDKLGKFESRIGNSPLVIDTIGEFGSNFGFIGTPSLTAVGTDSRVIVSISSKDLNDNATLNKAMPLIFK